MAINLSLNNAEHERLISSDESLWIKKLNRYFDNQRKELVRLINDTEQPVDVIYKLDPIFQVDPILSLYKELYLNQGVKYYSQIINAAKSLKTTNKQEPELSPEEQAQYFLHLERLVDEKIAERVTTLNENSRAVAAQRIKDVIEEATLLGLGAKDTAKMLERAINKEWRDMKKYRSHRIARTEVALINNFSSYQGALDTGLELKKEWSAALDSRTRITHVEASGQQADINGFFYVGGAQLRYPAEYGAPAEEVINCRCRLRYIVP